MNIEYKPIKKLTIKECKSAIRKLKKRILEMEDEMSYIESGIYMDESTINEIEERIKKLKK